MYLDPNDLAQREAKVIRRAMDWYQVFDVLEVYKRWAKPDEALIAKTREREHLYREALCKACESLEAVSDHCLDADQSFYEN
jgi:outer membrane lipopolysaccharide assembly protein LptE/RlpB